MATKSKTKSKTTFYSLLDVAKSYLALEYSCGIFGRMKSRLNPSFTNYMADGIPFLTFREILAPGGLKRYNVLRIGSQELPNDARLIFTLDDIKNMFKAHLNRKRIKVKAVGDHVAITYGR